MIYKNIKIILLVNILLINFTNTFSSNNNQEKKSKDNLEFINLKLKDRQDEMDKLNKEVEDLQTTKKTLETQIRVPEDKIIIEKIDKEIKQKATRANNLKIEIGNLISDQANAQNKISTSQNLSNKQTSFSLDQKSNLNTSGPISAPPAINTAITPLQSAVVQPVQNIPQNIAIPAAPSISQTPVIMPPQPSTTTVSTNMPQSIALTPAPIISPAQAPVQTTVQPAQQNIVQPAVAAQSQVSTPLVTQKTITSMPAQAQNTQTPITQQQPVTQSVTQTDQVSTTDQAKANPLFYPEIPVQQNISNIPATDAPVSKTDLTPFADTLLTATPTQPIDNKKPKTAQELKKQLEKEKKDVAKVEQDLKDLEKKEKSINLK